MQLERWTPPERRSGEDKLLLRYWQQVGGLIFAEVPTPRVKPRDSQRRRLDGVRIAIDHGHSEIVSDSTMPSDAVGQAAHGAAVEVIEVKRSLTRPVIGQAIVGLELFAEDLRASASEPASLTPVILCAFGDELLEGVCRRLGIKVWSEEPVARRAATVVREDGTRRAMELALLRHYLEFRGGTVFTQVLIGRCGPPRSACRSIDAVRIDTGDSRATIIPFSSATADQFEMLATGARVELIEVNSKLNRMVFGQVLAGQDLLSHEYRPASIDRTIVCRQGDALLERLCERRSINVWRSPDH